MKTGPKPIPLVRRFLAKVRRHDAAGNLLPGCWEWTAGVGSHGYGEIGRGGKYGGMATAHRVAWELAFGPIPDGLWVLHKCDNRRCCRPAHLFLGTDADNHRDSVSKSRQARGERAGGARLTASQVLAIRCDPRPGAAIATEYRIAQTHVSRIKNRLRWAHVP